MKNEIKKSGCAVLSASGIIMGVREGNVAATLTYVGLTLLSASAVLYCRCASGFEYFSGGLFVTEQGGIRMALHTTRFFKRFTKVL